MTSPARQRGVAMLLFALVLILGLAAVLYARLGKWGDATTAKRNVNAQALQQAKAALIGYVAKEVLNLSENVPGRLPCPEAPSNAGTNNEGVAAGNCSPSSGNTVGRLPWRTLGIDKLVDASGEPLWYAVAPSWVMAFGIPPTPPTINAASTGDLTFDGTADVVAVIFAPGPPLSTNPTPAQTTAGCTARNQTRADRSHVSTSVANPDYRDYLECQNASSPIDTTFGVAIYDTLTNPAMNDQAVVITGKELLNAIQGPLAERLQRTVAPLLSEYSTLYPSGNFLPYAFPFTVPDTVTTPQMCGPNAPAPQQTEGLLPLAPNAGACISTWGNFSVSGSGSGSCVQLPSTDVRCTFNYYQLSGLGALLFGGGATSADVTIQATAPHAAASFRQPLKPSDVSAPPGFVVQAATFTPQTDGDARLSLVIRITGTQLCDNLLLGVVCNLLPGLLASPVGPVSVQFPQLANSVNLQGTKLSPAVLAVQGPPYDLLSPAAGAPHYWFMKNNWYRYTYYAVAPGTSAAQTGGNLTVKLFPSAYGNNNDKRFVLALVGPPITGQNGRPSTAVADYMEGDNAATGASPRQFAYQVFTVSGNDRIATCPFGPGSSVCD